MRLMTFEHAGKVSWGAVADNGVVDLGRRLGGTLRQTMAQDALTEAMERAACLSPDVSLGDIVYLPPVPEPEKIICIGVNYADRNAEYKDGSAPPRYPSVFLRTPDSFTGHNQPLYRPPESEQLDYEGEIVLVIGKGGHRIPRERALGHIAGLTIMNEGTVRDWVRHAKFNVTQGKNFFRSGSLGPWMVTADEFNSYDRILLTTLVNQNRRQNEDTSRLIFPFDYLVAYLSIFFVLKPGDLIAAGTPLGAGARFDPPRYLVPGDVVQVQVEGVGELTNSVIDDPLE